MLNKKLLCWRWKLKRAREWKMKIRKREQKKNNNFDKQQLIKQVSLKAKWSPCDCSGFWYCLAVVCSLNSGLLIAIQLPWIWHAKETVVSKRKCKSINKCGIKFKAIWFHRRICGRLSLSNTHTHNILPCLCFTLSKLLNIVELESFSLVDLNISFMLIQYSVLVIVKKGHSY